MSTTNSCLSSLITGETPRGTERTIGELPCYVSEPPSRSRAKSIIIFADIFGWKPRHVRLLADAYARHGFYVYLPDLHQGSSFDSSFLQTLEPPLRHRDELSLVDRAKNSAAVAGELGPWQLKNQDTVVQPLASRFVAAVREAPGTGKIGALGLGWGGRHAILQAANPSTSSSPDACGGVDAAVSFYPSSVSAAADFRGLARPLSLGIAGEDGVVGAQTRTAMIDALEACKGTPHEVRTYDKQVHGFAIRDDWSSDRDKQAMDEAEQQGVNWFNNHLG